MEDNNREPILKECLDKILKSKCLLTLLSTGVGKTRMSIESIRFHMAHEGISDASVLLVVDKIVHKGSWMAEFEKWGRLEGAKIDMTCYASLHKYSGMEYDYVILDECHHIASEKRTAALASISIRQRIIGLSATLDKATLAFFRHLYRTSIVSCTTQEAIENNILPDPEILLVPLVLDNTRKVATLEINKGDKTAPVHDLYENAWKYRKVKKHAILACTARQRCNEYDGLILWYKKRVMAGNARFRNQWMLQCTERLKFLAMAKNESMKRILDILKDHRTLTFCASIEQSEILGENCIHSGNKEYSDVLDRFNGKEISHITAVNMLNENANLTECEYGIFANINASEKMQVQRVGRVLRHRHPKIIIPYFVNTREEEIVKEWMQSYNKSLIKTVTLHDLSH